MAISNKTRVNGAGAANRQLVLRWLVVLSAIILIGGVWAWYKYVHRSSYDVFWDGLNNNLRISGVTKSVGQSTGAAKINQTTQLFLGAQNIARSQTSITQLTSDGRSSVKSETIGIPGENLVRYTDIETPNGSDYSSIKGVWAGELLEPGTQLNKGLFMENLLGGAFPFSQLSSSQRQELVKQIKDDNVYDVDYKGAKVVDKAGKQAFEYDVKINIQAHLKMIKKIDAMLGLNQLTSLDPAIYDSSVTVPVKAAISIDGRQLLEVSYNDNARVEDFSGYGANIPIEIPEASLPRSELEQKVQEIFSPAGS